MDQKPAHRFNWKLFLSSLVVFLILILAAEGWYYWQLKGKLSAVSLSPRSTESSSLPQSSPPPLTPAPVGKFVATENIDVYESPGGKKLGFFVPGQKLSFTGNQEKDWLEILDPAEGQGIWVKRSSLMTLVEEEE